MAAYKAALTGTTKVVGLGPKSPGRYHHQKGNGPVFALQAALDGAIARGEYQQVLARWGEQGEAVAQSQVNPRGSPTKTAVSPEYGAKQRGESSPAVLNQASRGVSVMRSSGPTINRYESRPIIPIEPTYKMA